MTEPQAELFDIGYQHYDGPREGRLRATKSVWLNGVRTVLGLGRPVRAKIFPLLFLLFTVLMAVIFTIIASIAGELGDLPGADSYYQVVSFVLLLYAAVVAPELLCPDRRDGVISLYLVRPLSSTDYLGARWLAFFATTLVVLYLGQTVLFVGFTLAAADPLDYLKDNWLDVPRFLGAGIVFAALATTLPLAAAAFTTRRAYASAFVIGLFIVSSAATAILTGCDEESQEQVEFGPDGQRSCEPLTGDSAKWFTPIGLLQSPTYVNDLIFDKENDGEPFALMAELPTAYPVGWYLALVALPSLALWWRYRGLRL